MYIKQHRNKKYFRRADNCVKKRQELENANSSNEEGIDNLEKQLKVKKENIRNKKFNSVFLNVSCSCVGGITI